jgi:glyoxylase I family protein
MATRFHHVNICSRNVEEIDRFYKDILDLTDTSQDRQLVTGQGYNSPVLFLTDGRTEVHIATRDLNVAFRTGQAINPVARGHIAFRTDDIEDIKRRLTERGIPFADFGGWALAGWQQIFFHDPEGTIIEVHQVTEPPSPAGSDDRTKA